MAYTVPTAANLKARYPAFADVADETVELWITDAQRSVTTAWMETDYDVGIMALAAHNLALRGFGTQATLTSGIPTGITKLKTGQFDVSFTEQAANAQASGDLSSTPYGTEYRALLRINRGGALLTPTGTLPYDPARYPQGEE